MAEALARLTHAPESLAVFQGVNLRKDRLSLRDQDVARAINCDLHTQVGTALLRRGRALLYRVPTGPARLMQTVGTGRYLVSGTTLYKDGYVNVAGLSAALRTSLVPMQPLNDSILWVFLADGSGMRKVEGGHVQTWGISGPSLAATVAAGIGALSGVYTVRYTYVRLVGGAIAHESNPSPVSTPITVTVQGLALTDLVASGDPQVTHKRLYRTVNGGSVHLFDQQILNATTTAISDVADSGLGSAVETDNDLPPTTGVAVQHQGFVFLLDNAHPDYLWWSKHYRPESVPAQNFLRIGTSGDPLTAVVSLVGLLGVFTARTKYRVLGNDTSGFVAQEALSARGTPAPQAVLVTEKGCLFPARDGLFRTNFVQEDEELSQLIAPLFEGITVNGYAPINWAAADTMALAYWKERLYFAYPSGAETSPDMLAVFSFHTQQWYFYSMPLRCLLAEEPSDLLLAGTDGGEVYSLETGQDDNGTAITLTLEPASRSLNGPFLRKRFDYLRVDCDVAGGTLLCEVFIDDRRVRAMSLTGSRTRRLMRLQSVEGYIWRVRFTYVGSGPLRIDGVEVQAVLLEVA